MKTPTIYRQGDVLLIRTNKRVHGKPIERIDGRVVLALGEATGHCHSIPSAHCDLYADEQRPISETDAATMVARLGGGLIPDRILQCRRTVELLHQEHDTVKVTRGTYVVRIQREYHPAALRNVAD